MSDSNELNISEDLPTISVGEILKAAREAKKLDVDDICSYLRLSRRQVIALENNDFSVLPEATITRGFIRNYARMLDLDAAPLLEAYSSFSASNQPRPISIQSENIQIPGNDKRSWLMYIFASMLIVLLVTAWVVYVDYIPKAPAVADYVPSETESEATVQQALPVEAPEQVALPAEVAPADQPASSEPVTDVESLPASGVASEIPSTEQAIPAGQAVVRIKAKERSWVSITDRDNKNIFDKIMVADIEETVQGQPPLQVVIGNAPSTTLIFNNRPIDLAPVTNDRVARLKLE